MGALRLGVQLGRISGEGANVNASGLRKVFGVADAVDGLESASPSSGEAMNGARREDDEPEPEGMGS